MSPSKLLASSFELDNEATILEFGGGVPATNAVKATKVQAYDTLGHAQCFWANNGIAYEMAHS